jgi:hypothetical protein
MGVVVVVAALRAMPPMRGHIVTSAAGKPTSARMSELLADPTIRLALAINGLVMLTAFLVIPNIAPHLLQNLHLPRDPWLGVGYMIGGAASFLIMRIAGRANDRYGAARVSVVGTALMIGTLYFAFIAPGAIGIAGVMTVFVTFMGAMSVRNVSMQSLATRVPRADQRAATCRCRRPRSSCRPRRARSCRPACCTTRPTGAWTESRRSRQCPRCWRSACRRCSSILDRQVRAREAKGLEERAGVDAEHLLRVEVRRVVATAPRSRTPFRAQPCWGRER